MTAEVACEETDEEQIGQLPMFGSSQLKWYSTAAFMLRTWVRIPLKSPVFFFAITTATIISSFKI